MTMAYTPYDWQLSLQQRVDYTQERLRAGSPVVALSLPDGILMATVHQTQRKIYEIYDRLMFAGIGSQSDLENARTVAIDYAHREGFQRSKDDVSAQRLIGSVLSAGLKRAFADPFSAPIVFRGLFAELGENSLADHYYTLNFDGEYCCEPLCCVVAGSVEAENRALELLHERLTEPPERAAALRLALEAWALARRQADRSGDESDDAPDPAAVLREALDRGETVEVAELARATRRESRFRLLPRAELEGVLAEFR